MKEIIVHSGMPKTGTSALQVFFAKNRIQLLDSSLDYFEIGDIKLGEKGTISSGNGSKLSRSLLNPNHEAFLNDEEGSIWKTFINQINSSSCQRGLLSSEFFTNIPTSSLVEFRKKLNELGINLKFVFYVRRQDQFLMSGYMQRVKRHGYVGLPEEHILGLYKKVDFLNYFNYTTKLVDAMGADNVHPKIYEKSKNHTNGLPGDFLETIIEKIPNWVDKGKTINVSPSPIEIKMMLIANKFHPRPKFSDFLVEDSATVGRSVEYQDHSIIKHETVEEVMNYFSDQNGKFFNAYMEGDSFDKVNSDKYVDLNELKFSTEQVMEIISGFLVRYDDRLIKLEKKD